MRNLQKLMSHTFLLTSFGNRNGQMGETGCDPASTPEPVFTITLLKVSLAEPPGFAR